MPRIPVATALLTLLLGGPASRAQDLADDVKACRQLQDGASRLSCYDALPLPAARRAPAPAAADPVVKFGQEALKPAAPEPELKRVEARSRGDFHGWKPGSHIELDNGQVWRVADDSDGFYELRNPKATVHRGMLGAYYLEIEGIGFQIRVTRVR
jgi:hypothetical protein